MNEDCESCMEHAVDGASPCAIHGTVRPAIVPAINAGWLKKNPPCKEKVGCDIGINHHHIEGNAASMIETLFNTRAELWTAQRVVRAARRLSAAQRGELSVNRDTLMLSLQAAVDSYYKLYPLVTGEPLDASEPHE